MWTPTSKRLQPLNTVENNHLNHGLWRPSEDPRVSNYEKTIDEDKDIKVTLFSLREHIYFTPTFKDSGVTAEKGTGRV